MVGVGRETPRHGPRRGDVHIVDFPDIGGHVIRGPHPAVIVQTDSMARSSTVVIVPMTSAARASEFRPPFLVAITASTSGLRRDGWIKCDQLVTVPTVALGPPVGRISPEGLDRVDKALRFVLAL